MACDASPPPRPAHEVQNLHVLNFVPLLPPRQLLEEQPVSATARRTVLESRRSLKHILLGQEQRLLVLVGPCSIHDEKAAWEYAQRLAELSRQVASTMLVVMRVYFEKPRTTTGWKGLINDPRVDGSFDIAEGLRRARKLLRQVLDLGLPAATEFLDPIVPQYIADLITEAAIGARTTESPTHRQMASGLSMPVGFKNGTDGSPMTAVQAVVAARASHSFLGIDDDGRTAIVHTTGNRWGHVMLRGGRGGPNYSPQDIDQAIHDLQAAKLEPRVVVDCSHDNSGKDHRLQATAWEAVLDQRLAGNLGIIGLMLESNLQPGRQPPPTDSDKLAYGVSITDACIGWEQTRDLILQAHQRLESCHP